MLSHPTSTRSATRRGKENATHLDTSIRNDEQTVKALAMHTSEGKHSPSSRPRLASTPLDTSNISIVLQKGGDTYLAPRHLARPTSLQGGNGELLKYTTRRGKGKPTDLDGSTRNNEHAVKALGMTTSLWEHSPASPPRLASTPPATSINTIFKWAKTPTLLSTAHPVCNNTGSAAPFKSYEGMLTTYKGGNDGELLEDTVSAFPTVTDVNVPTYSTVQHLRRMTGASHRLSA
ncbi:hypothetical protein JR316_0006648 [Psilocybe cubensis]|uniref:Uncharacterized protein n=1 Tax=Psilocybe cubensis TaxID=181762 RepID=A0ACB8GWP0_PSICU|nr:hypothetical protein JR316_0006648 [Psilocybe cubensis]KAH9480051.1 hypothetical protein JR316_0006648 [Psilocybe cubensis]